ncbi:MAG TPA: universal stress protein [Steroidobacteraceae bacterium]|nr:universal stress protein [Steroidobacteraceae bacterium]
MNAPQRILFAIKDPDARRHATIDKVARLAKTLGARLDLFNAISAPVFLELQPLTGDSLGALRRESLALRTKQLEKLAARARRHGVETTVAVEWDFPPHEAIVRRAKKTGADLIVAECHKGRRRAPWLIRLTDWEMLRASPVPVLLLKNSRAWRKPTVLAAVDPSHAHAKPARLDESIVETALALARKTDGDLELMHANYPSLLSIPSGDPAMDAAALQLQFEERQRIGRREFQKFSDAHRLPKSRRHVYEGHPAIGIPRVARQRKADVVVMGAVSRSAIKRVFIGNTAERVLEALACDVLVVKTPHTEKAVARQPRGMRIVSQPPVLSLPV